VPLNIRQIAPIAKAAKDRQSDAICNLIIDEYETMNNTFGVIVYLRKYKATYDEKPYYHPQLVESLPIGHENFGPHE
jgi:hypothetical protein